MSDYNFDHTDDILDVIAERLREMDKEYFKTHKQDVSIVHPKTIQDVNQMKQCVDALFAGQDVDVDCDYGNGRKSGSVQAHTFNAILIGEQCKALAFLMRHSSSVNFTSMNSGRVMLQLWSKNENKGNNK